jgi:hypothetical protein
MSDSKFSVLMYLYNNNNNQAFYSHASWGRLIPALFFPNMFFHLMQLAGSLVTHIGSGISYEVSAALDIMISLASNNSEELIPLSSHITGKMIC